MPSTIAECIDTMNHANGTAITECHASTKVVTKALSGRKIETCDSGTLKTLTTAIGAAATHGHKRVYRIDLPGVGHSFALAQCGKDVAVFQSWEGCYTLQEWLIGTKEEIKKNPFLPKNGAFGHDIVSLYLGTLSADLERRENGKALDYVKALFNPTGLKVNLASISVGTAAGRPLEALWESEAIL